MKKILLTIFVVLILATIAIAEETSTECGEKDLTPEIDACKAKGGDYETKEDSAGCKYIECKEPTDNSLEVVETVVDNTLSECEEKDLTPEIDACKAKGGDYETKEDSAGCKYIECKEPTDNNLVEEKVCGEEKDLTPEIDTCKEKGGDYETKEDDQGCKYIECKEPTDNSLEVVETVVVNECKSDEDITSMANDCEASGGKAEKVEDEYGCTIVKCEGVEETIIEEEIKEPVEMETIECKKFKDEEGCEVISCVDGSEYNLCKICETNVITTGGAIAVGALTETTNKEEMPIDPVDKEDPLKQEIKEDDKFQPPKENVFKKMGSFFKGFFGK